MIRAKNQDERGKNALDKDLLEILRKELENEPNTPVVEADLSNIVEEEEDFESIMKRIDCEYSVSNTTKKGIVLYLHNLSNKKMVFVRESAIWVSAKIETPLSFVQSVCSECMHVIVETTSGKRCRRSYVYLLGVLLGKLVLSFNWYMDLFESSDVVSLETITLLNLVRGDMVHPSDIFEIMYISGLNQHFFCNVNIIGTISESARNLVERFGGTVQNRSGRLTIHLRSDEELYHLVTRGSRNPWHFALFPYIKRGDMWNINKISRSTWQVVRDGARTVRTGPVRLQLAK